MFYNFYFFENFWKEIPKHKDFEYIFEKSKNRYDCKFRIYSQSVADDVTIGLICREIFGVRTNLQL